MSKTDGHETIALMLSGGLDSSILLAHQLASGHIVQPIHIRTGVAWQAEEENAVQRYLRACRSGRLLNLVALWLPLDDLYGEHWSLTGRDAPGSNTPDESVYLPGRNPLLLVKAAVWCGLHGIEQIALATLAGNPFADATDRFFAAFGEAMSLGVSAPIQIVRPFSALSKEQVMRLGREAPLAHTFSCIAPVGGLHCGGCNKCAERKSAFGMAGLDDPTRYAHSPHVTAAP